jgi:hypothetical protein
MKKLFVLVSTVLMLVGAATTCSFAQTELNDLAVNVDGNFVDAENYATQADFLSALPPTDLSAFNTTTGLGSITITYDPGAGTYFMDVLDNELVGTPYYNTFGTKSGTAASGETWEIGDWWNSSIYYDAQGSTSDALLNTNLLPEGASNYLAPVSSTDSACSGDGLADDCNGIAAVALGETFTLGANQEEVLIFTVGTTCPGGLCLASTNPGDPSESVAPTTVYFSETATTEAVGTPPPPPPPPSTVPEPSSWILMATGMVGFAMIGLRRRESLKGAGKFLSIASVFTAALATAPAASAQTVLTVPWDPTNLASPHTTYAGASIVLGAVFTGGSSTDSYTYQWNYGDGSSSAAKAITNANDISTSHVYSVEANGSTPAVVGYTWNAVVTVTDTKTSAQYTGVYLVIWEANTVQTRVNVAIDWGLWYLHASMYHPSSATGNWSDGCASGYGYDCGQAWTSLTATNVQALEVNGHQSVANGGSSSDPYSTDVAEALDYLFQWINVSKIPATTSKYYYFDPATATFGCSDGSAPTTTNRGTVANPNYCATPATMVYYNSSATSCPGATTSSPCSYLFNSNPSGNAYYVTRNVGYDAGYEQGMVMDAIVASGNPAAVVPATNLAGTSNPIGVAGQTYGNIIKGFADYINYCQYGYDYDVASGTTRGSGGSDQGGGWLYSCNEGDDNSTSQWESIGLISAERGFGVALPQVVKDENQVWITNSETSGIPGNYGAAAPTGPNPFNSGNAVYNSSLSEYQYQYEGGFGYRGNLYYSNEWGPFAVTPSGMVQMSLDGVGRTSNTAFGAASNSPDQRFNNVETFYADNFCNSTTSGAYYSPRAYTYGLFSFTKSMLLHNPGNVLTPIQYLRTQTPGVFSNPADPANSIDWYAAVATGHYGGADACDGVAQTLIERQYLPANSLTAGTPDPGYWWAEDYNGDQYYFETAWSLIMLQRTVFVNCVNNLTGQGISGTAMNPARADLTWTGIPNVTGYNILVSTTNGGPYTQVSYGGGSTTLTAFADETGLTNGSTYYFVLQPVNATGAVCQSNQVTITIPKPR